MRFSVMVRTVRGLFSLVLSIALSSLAAVEADEPPAAQDSALVRLLKSGRIPEDRQGTIVEMIGKRGTEADLTYIYQRAIQADGFGPAIRRKALEALAEAGLTRGNRPSGDLSQLRGLIHGEPGSVEPSVRLAAMKLAGLWKVEALVETLRGLAEGQGTPEPLGGAALDALALIGNETARQAIEALTASSQPALVRLRAIAALAQVDAAAAAPLAAASLRDAAPGTDLQPLLAAFLNRQDGVATLTSALRDAPPSPDAAKLALRAMYALGRADAALVALLSKAAGLDAEVKTLDAAAMNALIQQVNSQGDLRRGEAVFRRADLNCVKCHALGGAGGGIGPDLSAIGQSSPVDYIVNSILMPDQAIKEEYHTLVVLTSEGQLFQGIVVERDDRRIVLKEATGELRTIAMDSVEDSKEGGSLMPQGLTNLMTHAEFVDLTRFLAELGKPGPYGIPTTPVVMRWSVRRGIPSEAAADPAEEESRWVPAFALVGGRVPLREFAILAGDTMVQMKAEIDVTAAGPVAVKLDPSEGVRVQVDDQPLPASLVVDLDNGRHSLMLQVDTAQRQSEELKVELIKPTGSTAEFTVVGGR